MSKTVLVIGGGPAGLTAALRLSARGYRVTIVDEAGLLDRPLPAPPTILLGRQSATFRLLDTLGIPYREHLLQQVSLDFHLPGRLARLRRPWLPGPLHGVLALAAFQGLSRADRWQALTLIERTWERDPPLPSDLDMHQADDWLADQRQSPEARRMIWDPLARLLTGEALITVSACALVRRLTRCFLDARRHSRPTILDDRGQTRLVQQAAERLRRSGCNLMTNSPAINIHATANEVDGITLKGGERLAADFYIAALPHCRLRALLPDQVLTRYGYFEQMTRLRDSPSLRVDLLIDRPVDRNRLVLLSGRSFHWILARNLIQGSGPGALISLVASGSLDMLERDDQHLKEHALADFRTAMPESSSSIVRTITIVRDEHAFLSLRPGATACRPLQESPLSNFFLAGAWTDTPLPSSLESAVVSGERCAAAVLAKSTAGLDQAKAEARGCKVQN